MSNSIAWRAKRLLDITVAAVGLVILSPIFLIVSIIVLLAMGSPIFFRHERPGMNEQPFKLIKFRTMLNSTDKDGNLLPDHMRISKFGIKLRSTSLDEIPALINVLKGDMSLVGPRPLMMRYLKHYSQTQRRRHEVRPGITGLAQINGRNTLSWDQVFEYDIDYIDNWSFLRDLIILAKTPFVAFSGKSTTDGIRKVGREPFDKEHLKSIPEYQDGKP